MHNIEDRFGRLLRVKRTFKRTFSGCYRCRLMLAGVEVLVEDGYGSTHNQHLCFGCLIDAERAKKERL